MAIPKTIFVVWLSEDGSMPPLIKKCIESQKIPGYEHRLITLDNCFKGSKYIQECLSSPHKTKKWCKASDYLRMHYLLTEGGIYLDADVEILPGKNFDDMLEVRMFVGMEKNDIPGYTVLGTAVVGAEPNHPIIKRWKDTVEAQFRGDDDKCYESSMDILNIQAVHSQDTFRLYPPEFFYPYDHLSNTTQITRNTRTVHHFMRSWIGLDKFIIDIENNANFSFVKRGDGEVACMNYEPGGNCDGHPYTKELGDRLKESFEFLKDKVTIVEFDNQKNYNMLLHRVDNNPSKFWKAVINSPRRKVYVGPERLASVAKLLKAKHIVIPAINAWASYTSPIDMPVEDNTIYIFSAGMPAKVMIAELLRMNPKITCIDAGSSFDPMIGQSRTYQMSTEAFKKLYEGLL